VHRICTRLHIYVAVLHTVTKGTLELMNSGVGEWECGSSFSAFTFWVNSE
jgi:hypothetical protein